MTSDIWRAVLSCGTVFGFIFLGSRQLDAFFPAHTKAELAGWIKRQHVDSWVELIIRIHDRLLVGPTGSASKRPKLWRSAILSLSVVILLNIVLSLAIPSYWVDGWTKDFGQDPLGSALALITLFVICNLFVDYVSLIETRFVLGLMVGKNLTMISALALMDILLTCTIVLIPWAVLSDIVGLPLFAALWSALSFYTSDLFGNWGVFGVFIYTTFATTVWAWLSVAARTAFVVCPPVQRWFPIDDRPFQSLGFVAGLLIATVYFGIALLA